MKINYSNIFKSNFIFKYHFIQNYFFYFKTYYKNINFNRSNNKLEDDLKSVKQESNE